MTNNDDKIAIMIDSCCDVPKEYMEKYHIYSVPLIIRYSDKEYLDKIDITSKEVIDRFEKEIPKTSLPSAESIKDEIDKIKNDGYNKLIIITISSGLSGTYNMISLLAREYSDIDIRVIDTKNIGIGAGFSAILAGDLIEQGKSFEEIVIAVELNVASTKIFFCVNTLTYLKKGGRIGLVEGTLGDLLDLKPIISCNDDGVYYTVSKVRGRNKSLMRVIEHAIEYANNFNNYNFAVVEAGASEEARTAYNTLKEKLPNADIKMISDLTPALVIHTGPGLLGICIQKKIS